MADDRTFSDDWRSSLRDLVAGPSGAEQRDVEPRRTRTFIAEVVVPAMEELAVEFQELNRTVEVEFGDRMACLTVFQGEQEEFFYEVHARVYRKRDFAFPVLPLSDGEGATHRAEASTRAGPLGDDVTDCTKEELIRRILREYTRQIRWSR